MGIEEILNRDTMMADIEELRDTIVNKFEELDNVILIWETLEGPVVHRCYGETDSLISLLAKAQYIFLRENLGATQEKPKEEE